MSTPVPPSSTFLSLGTCLSYNEDLSDGSCFCFYHNLIITSLEEISEPPSSHFHLSNTHTSYHHQDHYSHFTSYPSLLLFSRYEQYQDTMVSKDPKCVCVRLFKCLGLCKKKAQEDHELITIPAHDVPIIPPTRTQTIVPESSAGTKTRKLSIALPSKRTKQELSNDTCSNWLENINLLKYRNAHQQ